MKTNHRDGTKDNRAHRSNWTRKPLLKEEARRVRRNCERVGLHKLLRGDEDVALPTRNREAGNPWNWD